MRGIVLEDVSPGIFLPLRGGGLKRLWNGWFGNGGKGFYSGIAYVFMFMFLCLCFFFLYLYSFLSFIFIFSWYRIAL